MKLDVYNIKGNKSGNIEVSDSVFAVAWKPELVHFVFEAQRANTRTTGSHAKDRSEVSGGGRKPWRQKGTGRARHGSNRSPIWRGGGTTHGPLKERDFTKKVNQKQKQGALFSVLAKKISDNNLKVLESLKELEPKTKQMAEIIKALTLDKQSQTIILSMESKKMSRACANLPKIVTVSPQSLNVVDLITHRGVIIEDKALQEIEDHFLNKAKVLNKTDKEIKEEVVQAKEAVIV